MLILTTLFWALIEQLLRHVRLFFGITRKLGWGYEYSKVVWVNYQKIYFNVSKGRIFGRIERKVNSINDAFAVLCRPLKTRACWPPFNFWNMKF